MYLSCLSYHVSLHSSGVEDIYPPVYPSLFSVYLQPNSTRSLSPTDILSMLTGLGFVGVLLRPQFPQSVHERMCFHCFSQSCCSMTIVTFLSQIYRKTVERLAATVNKRLETIDIGTKTLLVKRARTRHRRERVCSYSAAFLSVLMHGCDCSCFSSEALWSGDQHLRVGGGSWFRAAGAFGYHFPRERHCRHRPRSIVQPTQSGPTDFQGG